MNKIIFSVVLVISCLASPGICLAQKAAPEIQINNFNIEKQQRGININWAVEESDSVNYFEIQKSNDGKHFRTLGIIFGPDPSKTGNQYIFLDKQTKPAAYYRLTHIDNEGKVNFSETKLISKR